MYCEGTATKGFPNPFVSPFSCLFFFRMVMFFFSAKQSVKMGTAPPQYLASFYAHLSMVVGSHFHPLPSPPFPFLSFPLLDFYYSTVPLPFSLVASGITGPFPFLIAAPSRLVAIAMEEYLVR